jgi:hypothetical protein
MATNRKTYPIRVQIVCAFASGVAEVDEQEYSLIEESFRSGIRTFKCDVISIRHGTRWFELIVETPPTFDLAKMMTSLKAVTSRAMHKKRGGDAGFWSLGYSVTSLGEPGDPYAMAQTLENNGIRK